MKKLVGVLHKDKIYKARAAVTTTCKFNPPYGPHFGGEWKRLSQSAKRTLLIILGSKRLSFDNFETIMVEVEATLNSSPLTNVADQPDNEEPLTSNRFPATRKLGRPTLGWVQELEARSSVDEPCVAAFDKEVPANMNQETWIDRQQPASFTSRRYRVGTQRLNAEKNLAPCKSCGNIPWARWWSTIYQGKNGLRLVRASGRRPRTGLVFVDFESFFWSGFRQH